MTVSKGTRFKTVEYRLTRLDTHDLITQKQEHIWQVVNSSKYSVIGFDGKEYRAFMIQDVEILEV